MSINGLSLTRLMEFPVSTLIATVLIAIFGMYSSKAISKLPCGSSIKDTLFSNFVHIDASHLISNLYGLFALSKVETEIGIGKFVGLFTFLLIFNTFVQYIARRIVPSVKCSIGFSGILFGIMTWELVAKKKLDMNLLIAILLLVITPSMKNNQASLLGHGIGAISGIIGGLLFKMLFGEASATDPTYFPKQDSYNVLYG